MLFFNGGAVCRIGHHHGVLTQMLSSFASIGQDALLELYQFESEISQLSVVHVVVVGHGHDFCIGQLIGFFGFPVIGQFGIFFHSNEGGRRQDLSRHVLQVTGFCSRRGHRLSHRWHCNLGKTGRRANSTRRHITRGDGRSDDRCGYDSGCFVSLGGLFSFNRFFCLGRLFCFDRFLGRFGRCFHRSFSNGLGCRL